MEFLKTKSHAQSQIVEAMLPAFECTAKIIDNNSADISSQAKSTNKILDDDSNQSESICKRIDNIDLAKLIKTEINESQNKSVDDNGKKQLPKRRSKNDADGRDFKCTFCTKTYLSYPALYTHMKSKHSQGPDGNNFLLNSGRGRGRPKKNAGKVNTISPETDDYFKTFDKCGECPSPLEHFESVIEELFSDKTQVILLNNV